MAGIYLHIPFCRRRCNYCDFVSTTGQEEYFSAYAEALNQEIDLYGDLFPDTVIETIYFGGGTPSIFPEEYTAEILAKLKSVFKVKDDAEISLEANPGTVTREKLATWAGAGVNRLSFGLQATQPHLLRKLGRIHSLEEAAQALQWAGECGYDNVSLDLIYGLPEQSQADLEESIAWVAARKVRHVSIYGLQVEENTVFYRWQEEGKLLLPSEEEVEAMYDYLTEKLPALGYERYEISNFAQKGFHSRHNFSYWQDVPYLGLGAGAHSYAGGKRWANEENLQAYIKLCGAKQKPVAEIHSLSGEEHMEEFAFLALRTAQGIVKKDFLRTFSRELSEVYGAAIVKLKESKLLWENDEAVGLTSLGMKYGNRVFQEFLL